MGSNIVTDLTFLDDDPIYTQEKPYEIISGIAPNGWKSNCKFSKVPRITIQDCRGRLEDFSIDITGFEFCHWPSDVVVKRMTHSSVLQPDGDTNFIINLYLQETIDTLKKELGAAKVICFDWRVRSRQAHTSFQSEPSLQETRNRTIEVANIVHLGMFTAVSLGTVIVFIVEQITQRQAALQYWTVTFLLLSG
ncbi:hypothetical protein F5Y08DRAFT_346948 [Xylaria arbuscula]|nr:hypothetical protein F5Y08DRAFT_346948 [Xylaria arbuscula]